MILTIEEAKAHLRITTGTDDPYIESLIAAAQDWIEGQVNRVLSIIPTPEKIVCSRFPENSDPLYLLRRDVTFINSVGYISAGTNHLTRLDENHVELSVVNTGAWYRQLILRTDLRSVWPATVRNRPDAVQIVIERCLTAIPERYKQVARALIGTWYDYRDASAPPPRHIYTLLNEDKPLA